MRSARVSCRWSNTGQRVSAATNAATLGELQSLVSDLQTSNAGVPDYASIERADPTDDRRTLRCTYRGGWDSDPTVSGKDSDAELVDLGKFDVTAIVGRLRGAPQILGIEQKDVKNVYLSIGPTKDPTTPDAIKIAIYVSTEYVGSGYLTVDAQGNILSSPRRRPEVRGRGGGRIYRRDSMARGVDAS